MTSYLYHFDSRYDRQLGFPIQNETMILDIALKHSSKQLLFHNSYTMAIFKQAQIFLFSCSTPFTAYQTDCGVRDFLGTNSYESRILIFASVLTMIFKHCFSIPNTADFLFEWKHPHGILVDVDWTIGGHIVTGTSQYFNKLT